MTATIVTGASRQSAVLAAVAGLHVGAWILFASGMVPRLLEALPEPPAIVIVPQIPEPVVRMQPGMPVPAEYQPLRAPLPDIDIPRMNEVAPPVDSIAVTDASATGAGNRGKDVDFQPPALQMRDSRLAALVDACYPSGARRMGEEGRAVALIVVGADGRAASWTQAQGTGFPRLDAALGCVIRRLQFHPGRRDGRAIVADVQLPIVFQLH
jgi:TonB family protein